MYDLRQRFPDGYLDRLDVIGINGSLLDGNGWHYGRSILPPNLELPATMIDFGTGSAAPHLGPGWSGGPVVNGLGEVVAVVVASERTSGVTLAVPIAYLPLP